MRLRLKGLVKVLRRHRWSLCFVLACLLVFLGPTYAIYALNELDVSWPIPDVVGFAIFSLGLVWVAHLLASGP